MSTLRLVHHVLHKSNASLHLRGMTALESKALIDVKPGANLLQIGGQDVEAAAWAAGKPCFAGQAFGSSGRPTPPLRPPAIRG